MSIKMFTFFKHLHRNTKCIKISDLYKIINDQDNISPALIVFISFELYILMLDSLPLSETIVWKLEGGNYFIINQLSSSICSFARKICKLFASSISPPLHILKYVSLHFWNYTQVYAAILFYKKHSFICEILDI